MGGVLESSLMGLGVLTPRVSSENGGAMLGRRKGRDGCTVLIRLGQTGTSLKYSFHRGRMSRRWEGHGPALKTRLRRQPNHPRRQSFLRCGTVGTRRGDAFSRRNMGQAEFR